MQSQSFSSRRYEYDYIGSVSKLSSKGLGYKIFVTWYLRNIFRPSPAGCCFSSVECGVVTMFWPTNGRIQTLRFSESSGALISTRFRSLLSSRRKKYGRLLIAHCCATKVRCPSAPRFTAAEPWLSKMIQQLL